MDLSNPTRSIMVLHMFCMKWALLLRIQWGFSLSDNFCLPSHKNSWRSNQTTGQWIFLIGSSCTFSMVVFNLNRGDLIYTFFLLINTVNTFKLLWRKQRKHFLFSVTDVTVQSWLFTFQYTLLQVFKEFFEDLCFLAGKHQANTLPAGLEFLKYEVTFTVMD